MSESIVVDLFHKLDGLIETVVKEKDELYLDSLAYVLRLAYFGAEDEEEAFSESFLAALQDFSDNLFAEEHTKQDIHRAIQMALLKGMKKEANRNHQMTPESIALFVGYLIQKLVPDEKKHLRLFNPASGTGNLLHTVLNLLKHPVSAYASEIDSTLLNISVMVANILEQEIEYFHQDSLRPLLLDPVDIVISDLPVGYYPDKEQAEKFQLKADEGHSYAHHLFIEQSLIYTKPGGYLIFLIPEFLFTSDQAKKLNQFLHDNAHIIGLFQLSDSTFKKKELKKSIFVLRKKGEHTKNVKQPLLVMLPSLKDTPKMENILAQINEWFKEEAENLA